MHDGDQIFLAKKSLIKDLQEGKVTCEINVTGSEYNIKIITSSSCLEEEVSGMIPNEIDPYTFFKQLIKKQKEKGFKGKPRENYEF